MSTARDDNERLMEGGYTPWEAGVITDDNSEPGEPIVDGFEGCDVTREKPVNIKKTEDATEFKSFTLGDALRNPAAYEQGNPWLFEGVLSRVGGGFINLDSGEGKSWIVVEAAICTALGLPLFGVFECYRNGPSLIFLEEDGKANAVDRAKQLLRGKDLDTSDPSLFDHIHFVCQSGVQLDDEISFSKLGVMVSRIRPAFVSLDPFAETHSQNENDAQAVLSVLRPLRRLALKYETFIAPTHHTRKGYAGQDSDIKQTGRGSSAMKGWADSAWYMKRVDERTYEVATKQRGGSRAHPAKDSFVLERVIDTAAGSVSWSISEGVEARIRTSANVKKALDAVTQHSPILNRKLKAIVGLSGGKLADALDALEDAKLITRREVKAEDSKGRNVSQKLIELAPQEVKIL